MDDGLILYLHQNLVSGCASMTVSLKVPHKLTLTSLLQFALRARDDHLYFADRLRTRCHPPVTTVNEKENPCAEQSTVHLRSSRAGFPVRTASHSTSRSYIRHIGGYSQGDLCFETSI